MATQINYYGNKDKAHDLRGLALMLMNKLENMKSLGKLDQIWSPVHTLKDGTTIRLQSIYDAQTIRITSPFEGKEITKEEIMEAEFKEVTSMGPYIYAAGYTINNKWFVEKFSASGTRKWYKELSVDGWAKTLAVDKTGVYIGGHKRTSPGNVPNWRVEKRSLTTGNLMWEQDIAHSYSSCTKVFSYDGSLYAVGTDTSTHGRISKINKTTGAVDVLVADAWEDSNVGLQDCYANASGLFVVGGQWETSWTDGSTYAVSRYNLTTLTREQLDYAPYSTYNNDISYSITGDDTGIYIFGRRLRPDVNYYWCAEKRSLTTISSVLWEQHDLLQAIGGNQSWEATVLTSGVVDAGNPSLGTGVVELRDISSGATTFQSNITDGTFLPLCVCKAGNRFVVAYYPSGLPPVISLRNANNTVVHDILAHTERAFIFGLGYQVE